MFNFIFYIVGIIFIIKYIGMPLIIWLNNKVLGRYKLIPIPEEEFLQRSNYIYKSLFNEVKRNKFRYIASCNLYQQKTNIKFSIFTNNEKRLSALVTQITAPNVPSITYLEVNQLFDDNTILNIQNSPIIGVYPESHRKVTFRFPEVKSFSNLVDIIELISYDYFSSKKSIALPEGEELNIIEQFLNEEQRELINKGYFQKSVHDNLRGLTLFGAYMFTWKMLWPIKQIREKRELTFSQKILASLENKRQDRDEKKQ